MSDPIMTLAICADFPHFDDNDRGLPDALRTRGIEPRIVVWDDPDVGWSQPDTVVLRSVRGCATKGNYSRFLQWARSMSRLANCPDVATWNSDKHYLTRLSEWGVPMIPTMWLEPEAGYFKRQVYTRFPVHGDFAIKPVAFSDGRGTGCYTATDAASRSAAVNDTMHHLCRGRAVIVQRYLEEVDRKGEVSLIYFNDALSYAVEKASMFRPSFKSTDRIHEGIVTAREPSEQKWLRGEQVRKAIHILIKEVSGRGIQLLFNRVDVIGDGQGGFYLMGASLTDTDPYLGTAPETLDNFVDAIAQRIFWQPRGCGRLEAPGCGR